MSAVGTITLDIGGSDGIDIKVLTAGLDGLHFVGLVNLQSELSTTGALSFAGSVKAKDGSYAALIDTAGSSAHWQVLKKAPALRLGDVVFDVSGEEKDCGANGNDVSIYVGSMSVENDAHDITSGDVTSTKAVAL